MGTSRPNYLQEFGNSVINKNPLRVLDIGVGFGKNGYLVREYTDIWNKRIQPDTWKTTIDGIEIFESYLHDASRFIYNNIMIGDVFKYESIIKSYDMVTMTDVLEHFDKTDAIKLMDILSACKSMFVTTPINPSPQGEVNGNVHETHRCKFTELELTKYGKVITKPTDNVFIVIK